MSEIRTILTLQDFEQLVAGQVIEKKNYTETINAKIILQDIGYEHMLKAIVTQWKKDFPEENIKEYFKKVYSELNLMSEEQIKIPFDKDVHLKIGNLVEANLFAGRRIGKITFISENNTCVIDGKLTFISDIVWYFPRVSNE